MQGTEGKQKRSLADRFGSLSPFGKSLVEGLGAGLVVFLLLVVWMALRADRTAERVQPQIPFKTAAIDLGKTDVASSTEPEPTERQIPKAEPLPPAPIQGLTESKNGLTLPISRFADDMTPFQAYKRPFKPVPGKVPVAIVVMDYGLSSSFSQSALDNLPADISFVLTPYADDVAKWGADARANGHEFWLALPMETRDGADTGPLTLGVNASLQDNQQRLMSILATVPGYVGLVSQKNHVFNDQDLDISPMLKQIFGRGLAFAESNPGSTPFGQTMAAKDGFPYVQNGVWLDSDLRPASIDQALQQLETTATKNGRAVAFVQPYPVVLKKIQDWVKSADDRGIQIAPLSALVQ